MPIPKFAPGRMMLARQSVELPFLAEVYERLTVPAGFVVASAVDSQRLWIVESP